jgi:hypothetical protein
MVLQKGRQFRQKFAQGLYVEIRIVGLTLGWSKIAKRYALNSADKRLALSHGSE